MKPITVFWGVAGTCLVLSAGCIHQESTQVREVPRVKVSFENETAARIFYDTLSRCSGRLSHEETDTRVEIPIILSHRRKVIDGPSVAFNRAVELCDTDSDGKITELEARIFEQTYGKRI